jgi:hypothetical protein
VQVEDIECFQTEFESYPLQRHLGSTTRSLSANSMEEDDVQQFLMNGDRTAG